MVANSIRSAISRIFWLALAANSRPAPARSPASLAKVKAACARSAISATDSAISRVMEEVWLTISACVSAPRAILAAALAISSVVAFTSAAVADSDCADSKICSEVERTSTTMFSRLASIALNDRARSPTSSCDLTSTLRVRSPWLITEATPASPRIFRVR